ncbi:MAG: hypothetical protein JWP69_572 [Flaviaesturariibacter sp.]|nr:hypothetical protein [Flaviaesturariibacter sp.]
MSSICQPGKKICCLFIVFIGLYINVFGQNHHFINQGIIEYEHKVNLYHLYSFGSAETKAQMPQFKSTFFKLMFDQEKSLYKLDNQPAGNDQLPSQPTEKSVVYQNLKNKSIISQKNVFENIFLVKDSIRKTTWKLLDEERVIAGYRCKRANGVILDSIYVVAFYTEEIITPLGPASFSGLPGMILGVVLPREHISWFATRVHETNLSENQILPPVQGTLQEPSQFKTLLQNSRSLWGANASFFFNTTLL